MRFQLYYCHPSSFISGRQRFPISLFPLLSYSCFPNLFFLLCSSCAERLHSSSLSSTYTHTLGADQVHKIMHSAFCPSTPPPSHPSPLASPFIRYRTAHNSELPKDNLLNMSPGPSHPALQLERILLDQSSMSCSTEKECLDSTISVLSHGNPLPKSSAQLMTEIATLESEIMQLERHLLSLYRRVFEQNLTSVLEKHETHAEYLLESSRQFKSDRPYPLEEPCIPKFNAHFQEPGFPSCNVDGSNIQMLAATPKSSSRRAKNNEDFGHRSLADHLGASRMDDAINYPDRLSEEIIRCISSIYCRLANPTLPQKGYSISSESSLSSSSTFSPRNHSGSWSSHCDEDCKRSCECGGLRSKTGPYAAMIEVLEICLDDESFNYAAIMLQKFRSLVKCLEKVDPRKMKREEKLAFWINIHNALVMHAYLAYGTQNYVRSTSVLKAAYNVGGHSVNAYVIQSSILGIRPHYSASWFQSLLSPGKKFVTGSSVKHVYTIEYPEPLVHFALCSGACSDPAVRVYTAKSVFQDLKVAKEEFIQTYVYIYKEVKIYLPKILCYFAKDMSLSLGDLLETISFRLSEAQQKAIRTLLKGRPEKHIYWLSQSSNFRYLIHREVGQGRPF